MTDDASCGGYMIPTLLDKRSDGIYIIAFCPICDKAEESPDCGNEQNQAATDSIRKVRRHMLLKHRVKEDRSAENHFALRG
jgi:hypothetical protein